MKKLFSLLFWTLAVATLFLPKHTNAQSEYFNVDTVYNNCNEKIALAIWAKQSALDSFDFDVFSVSNRTYSSSDTVILVMTCFSVTTYADFFHDREHYYQKIRIEKKKCAYPELKWNWPLNLDSATQSGTSVIHFKDTNKNVVWQELSVIKLFETNGKPVEDVIETYDLENNQNTLTDTFTTKLSKGKYVLFLEGTNKNGCDASRYDRTRWVGHFQKTKIDDNGFILDSIYYWHPGGDLYCDLALWNNNTSCIDTNGFFYNPDSNRSRYYWYENVKQYKGPKFKEAIYYDFNSDGIIDSMRPKTKYTNWDLNSRLAAVRIPEQYQQDTLTVWSRDSLGQWQSSNPIPYTNCSYFKRHDYFSFTKYNGECQFSSDEKYNGDDTLHIKIRKLTFNGNDTSYNDYDAFSFQANSEIFKPLDYGHYIIERVTNDGICDAPIYDTVVSCASFNEIIEDSVFQDSLSIFNGFSSKSDSILIKVIDTLNNWLVIDSVWLGSKEQYLNVFPNGNYFVGYYSNTLDCGFERMWNLHNSSLADDGPNSVKIFPNPTSHIVNVVIPVETGSYRLFDFTGREVKSGILNKGVNKLVLSELPKGVYIMEINSGNEIINFSTIKN